jgi:methanogenic corrinoid protein MtbC1
MHTIKRAAELTGIGPSTLRAWERRYGVISPERSSGRYRLYSAADLRALAIMASLVHDGWSASEAAAETLSRISAEVPGGPAPRRAEPQPPGLEELVAAAGRLDSARVAAVLDRGLRRQGLERALDGWLMPTLEAVGDAWADGRVSVAGEHLVSYAVQRRLAGAYERASGRAVGPAVVLGLPPGAHHELGMLAFAVLARRAGLSTAYVGADLPAQDWEAAVVSRRAAAVVVAVPRLADVVPAEEIIHRLARVDSRLVIGIGGRYQEGVGAGSLALGHDLAAGAAVLASRLAQQRRSSR